MNKVVNLAACNLFTQQRKFDFIHKMKYVLETVSHVGTLVIKVIIYEKARTGYLANEGGKTWWNLSHNSV